jgi:hypothetical protein
LVFLFLVLLARFFRESLRLLCRYLAFLAPTRKD